MEQSMIKFILPALALLCAIHCYGYSIDAEAEFKGERADTTTEAVQQQEEAFDRDYEPKDDGDKSDNAETVDKQEKFQIDENSLMTAMNQANLWRTNIPKTGFRQSFEYVCAPGSGLSHLYSVHLNAQEDRQWQFKCRKISNNYPTNCQWSAVHGFDKPLQGMCASGYVVTGFRSLKYSTFHRDRQFSVRCCKMPEVGTCCKRSGYLNNWDAPLNYVANNNKIITGIYSYHDNYREDRRFLVKYCDIDSKLATYDCSC